MRVVRLAKLKFIIGEIALIERSALSRRSCAGGEVSGTAAAAHDEDTGKDHQSRKDFLPGKGFHSKTDTDDSGNDWLGIAVHTHEGRSEAFLPERNQEIADECRKDNQEREFKNEVGRNCVPAESDHLLPCKRKRHEG